MKFKIFKDSIVIRPIMQTPLFNIREWWRYRELFFVLTVRDIKLRYKNTYIGILWIIIQPILSMIVLSFIFGRFAKPHIGAVPYWLFVLFGIVYWNLFSVGISQSSQCLLDNKSLIKKIYFPKELLVFSAIFKSCIDFLIGIVILVVAVMITRTQLTFQSVGILALFTIPTVIASLGAGFFVSSINVKYHDVRFIIPYFVQVLFFLTPVVYSLSSFSGYMTYLLALNPMVGIIDSIHSILTFGRTTHLDLVVLSLLSSIVLFFFGFWYFRSTERNLIDIL